MSKVQNPVIGAASGKMANVVFSRLNGENIMRAKPLEVRNPQTTLQQTQRQKFSLIQAVLSLLLPVVRLGFAGYTQKMSAFAFAMKKNIMTAISGNYPNQTCNFLALQLADGIIQPPQAALFARNVPGTIEIDWDPADFSAPSQATDLVHAVVGNADGTVVDTFIACADRADGTVTLTLNSDCTAESPLYVHIFCTPANPTVYGGPDLAGIPRVSPALN